jgi:hypothetical protein
MVLAFAWPAMRAFDAATIRQVIGNSGGAEGMAADWCFNAGISRAAAHHVPDFLARHPPRPELFGFQDRDAEQRPLGGDARLGHIGVEVGFQRVMAGHFRELAVLLVEAQPPAFFLGEVILDVQCYDRAHARRYRSSRR